MKRLTAAVTFGSLAILAIVWVAYDVYAISQGGTEASISFLMYEWSFKYPIFTWACGFFPGVLVGHFFWRIRDTEKTLKLSEQSRK